MKKFFKYSVFFILGIIGIYSFGPRTTFKSPKLLDTDIKTAINQLENQIAVAESAIKDLKPNNQSQIIWADSLKQQTEYCLVYVHGFSASQMEGHPVHRDFAKRFGMNLFLPRLEDHGRRDTNSFLTLTPETYFQSAEDALDIAKILGKKVIVMSCSSGSTLAIGLAAAGENIHSMILYSPNIDIADPMSDALLYPWGKQISRMVMHGDYNRINYDSSGRKYWNPVYHMNGIFALKSIINEHMTPETFAKINIPIFMGYYFKDQEHQDNVVSVPRMLEFFDQVGTPEDKKTKVSFPASGHHVISSELVSKDVAGLKRETFAWAEKTLGLKSK